MASEIPLILYDNVYENLNFKVNINNLLSVLYKF